MCLEVFKDPFKSKIKSLHCKYQKVVPSFDRIFNIICNDDNILKKCLQMW